jgi:GTPase
MADRLGASLTTLRDRVVVCSNGQKKKTVEILVRKVPDCLVNINIRIAVLGNCEAGKSTLISVLTHNELDNGSGRARLNLLRHIHEIQTGHTSSISNEIMGFNNNNEVNE